MFEWAQLMTEWPSQIWIPSSAKRNQNVTTQDEKKHNIFAYMKRSKKKDEIIIHSAIFVGHLIWKETLEDFLSLPPIRSLGNFALLSSYYYTCMCNLCYDTKAIRKTRKKTPSTHKPHPILARMREEQRKSARIEHTETLWGEKKANTKKKREKKECVYKKWIETREKNRYETRPRRPFMPYVNNVCSPNSSSKSILFYVYAQTTLFQPNESFSPVSDFSCL